MRSAKASRFGHAVAGFGMLRDQRISMARVEVAAADAIAQHVRAVLAQVRVRGDPRPARCAARSTAHDIGIRLARGFVRVPPLAEQGLHGVGQVEIHWV
jgi:hypothetical protein